MNSSADLPVRMTGIVVSAELVTLAGEAQAIYDKRDAAATRAAYATDRRLFTEWCESHGLQALPAEPATVIFYLTDLRGRGQKRSSIVRKASAISRWHRDAGMANPCVAEVVKGFLTGLRKDSAEQGEVQRQAQALGRDQLAAMLARIPASPIGLRDRAVILVGFAGLFRRSELASLRCSDIETIDGGLSIRLRSTKSNKSGDADRIGIARGVDPDLCPMAALLAWHTTACGCELDQETPLFRTVGKGGRIGGPMDGRAVAAIVRNRAEAVGLKGEFSAHSLRRGGATHLARKGATQLQLERSGRWKPGSAMPSRYVAEAGILDDGARLMVL